LGNETGDNISALGVFTTNLVPSQDNQKDIGIDVTAKWRNVYATNISGAIAATNGVVSGSSQITSILDSLNSFSGSQLTQNSNLATISGSLILTASANTISVTNLNSFSGSQLTQNTALATISGSLILTASANTISITNLNSFSSSQLTQNTALATITGSLISTASANTISLTEIHSYTSSLKTAFGLSGQNVTVNGNLTVNGTTTQIDSTTVQIGDNIIELNGTGIANGGLLVKDPTGGSTISGSLLWDSTLDYWKGGALGDESKLLRAGGDSVVSGSSQILGGTGIVSGSSQLASAFEAIASSTHTIVSGSSQILGGTTIHSGSYFNGISVVSGSSQIIGILSDLNSYTSSLNNYTSSANTWSGTIDTRFTTLGNYTASVNQTTSSLNLYTASANVWSGTIDTRFTTLGTYTASVNQTTSSLNSYTASISTSFGQFSSSYAADSASFDYRIDTLDPGNLSVNLLSIQQTTASLNTFSASAKISITNLEAASSSYETNGRGIVSGSSQITYANISSIPAGIVSGAAQVTPLLPNGVISGSSQISSLFEPIASSTHTLVSGSSQVLGGSGIHSGSYTGNNNIVSGSSQITYASISSIPSGIVSGSSQILGGSGIVSGSSQITYASISSIPSGIVSGAAQIPALLPSGVVSGSSQVITSNAITLGTHTTGNYVATITGTANQITVAGSGLETAAITLSTPQDIHTSANVQFNSIGVGTAATAVTGEIRAMNDITAFYSSDIRLKENIFPIRNALQKVNEISGNTYDWKEGFEEIHSHKGNDVGVIAQEIEIVLPEIVTNRDNGYKAVQYEKIIPLLIEAIKELSAKVKELENK
jgi:hypothetical protein